ncbi:hypothetical protein N7478_005451 [Penicillium angulare]|uniref:uncharacterized protein n=1 Tax=Penicillium angulare TaxID=116970 RepID=UPI002540BDE4|nr:uncharacterized protein N7478_005451 [Penicillium angulare]KAJ5280079.1 hypothetical protein N7478_005451 [Penicillium angulare]
MDTLSKMENGSALPTPTQQDEAPSPLFSRIETISKRVMILLIVAMSAYVLADDPVCHFVLGIDEDTCQSWDKYIYNLRERLFSVFAFLQLIFAIYVRYWAPEDSQSTHERNSWDGVVWTGSLKQSLCILLLALSQVYEW